MQISAFVVGQRLATNTSTNHLAIYVAHFKATHMEDARALLPTQAELSVERKARAFEPSPKTRCEERPTSG